MPTKFINGKSALSPVLQLLQTEHKHVRQIASLNKWVIKPQTEEGPHIKMSVLVYHSLIYPSYWQTLIYLQTWD